MLLGRLAVAWLEQLEIADEPAGRAVRELTRLDGVADFVLKTVASATRYSSSPTITSSIAKRPVPTTSRSYRPSG